MSDSKVPEVIPHVICEWCDKKVTTRDGFYNVKPKEGGVNNVVCDSCRVDLCGNGFWVQIGGRNPSGVSLIRS